MSDNSSIEWTDATWNPITGCSLVSEGCRHCYAATLAAGRLRHHPSRAGLARRNAAGEAKFTGEVRFNEEWLDQPIRWRRPRRIFVCAHGDLFHEAVPDEWIDRVFAVMALAPHHVFQVLTKRPERAREYIATAHRRVMELVCDRVIEENTPREMVPVVLVADPPSTYLAPAGPQIHLWRWPLPNVWLGTSVEDQAAADARIPHLLEAPAAVRFISCEPLLGPLDLTSICFSDERGRREQWNALYDYEGDGSGPEPILDWVIVGGESGPGARDMDPDWARSLRDQCAAADVSFFMKQMARKAEIPADLLIRQWPKVYHA